MTQAAEKMLNRNRLIALCPLTVTELTGIDTCRVAMTAGYDAMGLRFWRADINGNVLADDKALLRETLRYIQGEGMTVFDLTVATLDEHTPASRYIPSFEDAASTGARNLVLVGRDPEPNRFIDELAKFCEAAAPFGLSTHVEFMATSCVRNLDEAKRACQAVPAGNAHILLDTMHFVRTGHRVEDLRDIPPDMIKYLQICDGPDHADDLDFELRFDRLMPGKGKFPLVEILRALPSDLPISVEVPQHDRQLAGVAPATRASEGLASTLGILAEL
jgi:sugar phosphate isomerase/epimerase